MSPDRRRHAPFSAVAGTVVLFLLSAFFARAAEESPPPRHYEQARDAFVARVLVLARVARSAGDLETAARLYRDAFELRPYDRDIRRALTAIYEQREHYEALAEVYETVLDRVGSSSQVLAELARARLAGGRREEGLASLRRLVVEDLQNATRPITAAEVCAARGLFDDALDFLDDVLARFPRNPRLESARARVLLLAGKPEEALGALASALKHARGDDLRRDLKRLFSQTLAVKGRLAERLGRAREDYEKARDEQITRLIQRAEEARRRGDPASARDHLNHALRLAGDARVQEAIRARIRAIIGDGDQGKGAPHRRHPDGQGGAILADRLQRIAGS